MALDEEQKYKLEDFFLRMKAYRARHTELITVYVPAGMDLNLITRQLESEKSTAANIKSTATRKNVQEALESLIRLAKQMKTPKNGVAMFAGNVSQVEGRDDFIVEFFEPPEELGVRLYRCDQTFVLDPLAEMLEIKEVYGLLVIERKEATIGLLIGKKIKVLQHVDSFVPGKVRAGGQCLSLNTIINVNDKNCKLREIEEGDKILGFNFKTNKVEDTICTHKWLVNKDKQLIITLENKKSTIASYEHLFYVKTDNKIIEKAAENLSIKDKLIDKNGKTVKIIKIESKNIKTNLIDIETKNHNFIANGLIVHNSSQRYHRITEGLAKDFYRKIAEIVKREFFDLKELKGILVGGPGPTKEDFLKEGNLATALMNKVIAVKDIGYADEHGLDLLVDASQDVISKQEIYHEKNLLEKFFNMLGKEREKTAYKKEEVEKALSYGAVDILLISRKLTKPEIQKYEKLAQETSVKVEMVSVETDEGVQFWNLGGLGAILRFKII
jgi:peptide subunit release factor 1 (eRF1)